MKKPVKKPVRTSTKRKRKPIKKKGFDPDRIEMTNAEIKAAKNFKEMSQEIITPLEQLAAKIAVDLEAIKIAKKRVHFLRALRGTILSSPHILWCPQRKHQTDILVCEFVCKSPCTHFIERRYICKMLRCTDEQMEECYSVGNDRCRTFYAFEPFALAYINAYKPLHTIHNSLDSLGNVTPTKKKKFRRKK